MEWLVIIDLERNQHRWPWSGLWLLRKKSAPSSTSSVLIDPLWAIRILYNLFEQTSPSLLSSPSNPSVFKSLSRNSFSCTCELYKNQQSHKWCEMRDDIKDFFRSQLIYEILKHSNRSFTTLVTSKIISMAQITDFRFKTKCYWILFFLFCNDLRLAKTAFNLILSKHATHKQFLRTNQDPTSRFGYYCMLF